MVRLHSADVSVAGTCDHCGAGQVITVVTLRRKDEAAFTAKFCERHFLLFSDLVSDQVAALLYPKRVASGSGSEQ
ncbi:MAG: hypothetical protein ACREJ4_01275 [Candidatus Methylomirabilaceae bacterium]